jgi:hypothetical protein
MFDDEVSGPIVHLGWEDDDSSFASPRESQIKCFFKIDERNMLDPIEDDFEYEIVIEGSSVQRYVRKLNHYFNH